MFEAIDDEYEWPSEQSRKSSSELYFLLKWHHSTLNHILDQQYAHIHDENGRSASEEDPWFISEPRLDQGRIKSE